MCDPLTLAGAAASIGGSVMSGMAQKNLVDETNRQNRIAYERSRAAREAELARQAGMEGQSREEWDRTLGELGKESREANQDKAAEEFVDTFDARAAADKEGQALADADRVTEVDGDVAKAIATKINAAAGETRKRIEALARLSGYGSADAANSLALNRNADFIGTMNGMRSGSLGASQWEQNIGPAQVTPGSSFLADILSGAGGLLMGAGGTFGGGGATTPPLPRPNPLRSIGPHLPMTAGVLPRPNPLRAYGPQLPHPIY